MIEQEITNMLANAIWSEDITKLSADELDKLAMFQWDDDPDVEWDELGLSNDAGSENHGNHTDEQMLQGPDGPLEEDIIP